MTNLNHTPFAITMGDPAGIGPEIIAMLHRDHAAAMQSTVVYGDAAVMRRAANVVGVDAASMAVQQVGALCAATDLPKPGQVSALAGRMAADAVNAAALAALHGQVRGLVTAPLHKEALALAGAPFPGHTEILQALCAAHVGRSTGEMPVRMMLANDEIKTVLVSIHVPLREALESLSTAGIFATIQITHDFLQHTGLLQPRIAVAGINPHAGEGGLFGREELDIIAPAITKAQQMGLRASGAYAPDTVFMRARMGEFDAVIAMYHDQGLIPVKYMGVERGVNVTLGLPIIRTSPDHGTAMDIAGTNTANPSSLLYALSAARAFAA